MSRGEEYLAKEVAAAAERLRRLVNEANFAMAYLVQLGCEVTVTVADVDGVRRPPAPPDTLHPGPAPRLAVTVAKRILSCG